MRPNLIPTDENGEVLPCSDPRFVAWLAEATGQNEPEPPMVQWQLLPFNL